MKDLNDVLGKLTDFLKTEAKTENVIGKEFQLGEFKCVPVIGVGLGLGVGSGEETDTKKNEANGSGGGAGIGMAPVGFLITKGNDIQFIPTKQQKSILGLAFEQLPHLLQKYFESTKTKKEDKTTA
jgi:uncharacterized spore protein YtfJ